MAVITGKDEELLIGGRWVAAECGAVGYWIPAC